LVEVVIPLNNDHLPGKRSAVHDEPD
jgi:hypothetical protein